MGAGLPYEFVDEKLHERRERVFLVLAGVFLGTLAMLNILGITRFIDMSFELFGRKIPFVVAVGVLPYAITFLCTDFISELYGRRRATFDTFRAIFGSIRAASMEDGMIKLEPSRPDAGRTERCLREFV